MNYMHSIFSRLCHSPIPHRAAVLLVALAWTSLAQGQASRDLRGETIWYQGEHTVSVLLDNDGQPGATMSVSAGTIITFDSGGQPQFIRFSQVGPNGTEEQRDFGVDGTGPKNKGRLIYKTTNLNKPIPYMVIGIGAVYQYHLKYLELTTAGNETNGYNAYATKAIAFDNKVEILTNNMQKVEFIPTLPYKLPEGGQLAIDNGRIKIGDRYISPTYELKGEVKYSAPLEDSAGI
ncbi:MAG: hypothetical protein ACLPT4_13150 [Verrucomicrobiia bacterium]